jgi:hypothetical protein
MSRSVALLHPGTSHVTGVATTVGNTAEAPSVCNSDGSEHQMPTGGDPEVGGRSWSRHRKHLVPGRREISMTTLLTRPELTAVDRCDRCGAAAQVRAILPSGGELLFCGHHAREHSAKLRELSAEIQQG